MQDVSLPRPRPSFARHAGQRAVSARAGALGFTSGRRSCRTRSLAADGAKEDLLLCPNSNVGGARRTDGPEPVFKRGNKTCQTDVLKLELGRTVFEC